MKTYPLLSILVIVAITAMTGCGFNKQHNLPPAQQMMQPGPGVGGPGPSVLMPAMAQLPVQAPQGQAPSVQVTFLRPEGMLVHLPFADDPLVLPARQDLALGGYYRLRLSQLPNRPATDLYPTIEIGPTTRRTAAYLDHNAIPIQFTEEDFDQVQSGNFVTKVIYLPDPEFQGLAMAGIDVIVSTRLDPGEDPIVEADRRGSIMAIIRMGNKNINDIRNTGGGDGQWGNMMQQPNPGMAPQYISGMNGPAYGIPMVGTNIGLPGPPHIPFGGPAGMREYVMHNHTKVDIPDPTSRIDVHVRQVPGYNYPKQPSHVFIREQNIHSASPPYAQPPNVRRQVLP